MWILILRITHSTQKADNNKWESQNPYAGMYKQYESLTIEDVGRVDSLLFLLENMNIECGSVSDFIICV